jgi:signal transduction histidine kinase
MVMAAILLLFYFIYTTLFESRETVLIDMLLLILAFAMILGMIYLGAKRVEKYLQRINRSLKNIDAADDLPNDSRVLTREFQAVNRNLNKVLIKAKKREEDKQKYNLKLKMKNRQRSDMLSAIAHEFRNPISVIMGYSQTLNDDPDISRVLREKFLTKIYDNGQKIENLLSRLVLWNKFESGEARVHLSNFDIYPLIKESSQALKEKYKGRAIRIEGEGFRVKADRTLIEIALKNLIENALKYSRDEVLIKVEGKRISIVDRGSGISKKDISKVTKKFYRSGAHDWDNSMGLGLSIVKNILSMHDAKLEIESKERKGSTFSFSL